MESAWDASLSGTVAGQVGLGGRSLHTASDIEVLVPRVRHSISRLKVVEDKDQRYSIDWNIVDLGRAHFLVWDRCTIW